MARILERHIEAHCVRYVKRKGGKCYKFTSPSRRSVPDRIVISPQGVTGYLELKAPGKEPTAAQWAEIKKIQSRNAPCDYADTKEKVETWVDWLFTLPGPFPSL